MTDIIKKFENSGFLVVNLFNKNEINDIKKILMTRINKIANKKILRNSEQLKNFHKINLEEKKYKKIVKGDNRYIRLNNKILKKIKFNSTISNISSHAWGHSKFYIMWDKDYVKFKNCYSGYRLARPYSQFQKDVGGEHADFLKNKNFKDSTKSLLTIWCPLVGFNKQYSLRIAKGSHKKKHPIKKIKKNKTFSSPVMNKSYTLKFKFYRPKLKEGQALIFHPNLLHGGSVNKGNHTRVSVDFRIFNKKVFKNFKKQIKKNFNIYSSKLS